MASDDRDIKENKGKLAPTPDQEVGIEFKERPVV
jgi:hypothetical protein